MVFEYNEYIVLSTSLFRDLPNREYTYFLTVLFLAIKPLIFLMDASSLSWNAFSNSAFNFFFRWLFSRVFFTRSSSYCSFKRVISSSLGRTFILWLFLRCSRYLFALTEVFLQYGHFNRAKSISPHECLTFCLNRRRSRASDVGGRFEAMVRLFFL